MTNNIENINVKHRLNTHGRELQVSAVFSPKKPNCAIGIATDANTQTQRPRSTGHEDSEKKHLYPTHNQSKSEIPYDKSNAVEYDEIFSSLQYQQKQQKNTYTKYSFFFSAWHLKNFILL